MSPFVLGLLAFPAVIVAISAAASAVLGAWLLYEKWAKHRLVKLKAVSMPEKLGALDTYTLPDLAQRQVLAALTLTTRKVSLFQLGPSTGIILIRGGEAGDPADQRILQKAIPEAIRALHEKKVQNGQ